MSKKLLCAVVLLFCISDVARGSGPENAVVVVNSNSASSKLIANHYIFDRKIPPDNVIYLDKVPNRDVIPVQMFRETILAPIIKTIDLRKFGSQIDYVIYSSDFPTIIDARSDRDKLLATGNPESRMPASSKMLNPYVSITSATFFFRNVLAENASYLSLSANTYSRSPAKRVLSNPFVGDDAKTFQQALKLTKNDQSNDATDLLESLAKRHPLQMAVLYWLARTYAWKGEKELAINWLKRSVAVGWCYQDYTNSDTAFASLKNDESFQAIVALIPNLPFRYAPTLSFRSAYNWGPNGMINSTPNQGNRYLLSTMLAVNRNQGTTEQETLDYLSRSIAADGTKPIGTFYFTKTKNVRTRTRDKGIDEAVEELRLLGQKCEIVSAVLPKMKNDIAGLTIGVANFKWRHSGNSILPGAICENLTSFGGRLIPNVGQTKLTEFLRHGAAGSSGTVVEPYAVQEKFPHPRVHVHYVRGCTLAESFYQSVEGPFQLLVVGDALCKPWAKMPKLSITGDLLKSRELSGFVEFGIDTSQSDVPIRLIEMFLNGRLIRRIQGKTLETIKIDTAAMPDGYHEFRFVANAGGSIATKKSVVVPVFINNSEQLVSLTADTMSAKIDDRFEFEVTAPGASEVQLIHNGRALSQKSGVSAKFKISAYEFGRGPVSVMAMAKFDDQIVRSRPLPLIVQGPLSNTVPKLAAAPKAKRVNPSAKPKKISPAGGSPLPDVK